MYPIRVKLRCRYPDPAIARNLHGSLEPDNEGYINSWVEGDTIIAEVEAGSILSMRATLDDFLACLGTAEKVMFVEK